MSGTSSAAATSVGVGVGVGSSVILTLRLMSGWLSRRRLTITDDLSRRNGGRCLLSTAAVLLLRLRLLLGLTLTGMTRLGGRRWNAMTMAVTVTVLSTARSGGGGGGLLLRRSSTRLATTSNEVAERFESGHD